MDGSAVQSLHIWDEWCGTTPPPSSALSQPEVPPAEEWASTEALRPIRQRRRDPWPEPFTLPWYERVEHYRHNRPGAWLPQLLEFCKHPGESVWWLGDGLGTDAVGYAKYGAEVTVVCPTAERLTYIRRNFALRGLPVRALHASLLHLPTEKHSVDVVCLDASQSGLPSAEPLISELYRVLKPGGKILALVPAYYDVPFWQNIFFPWERWLRRRTTSARPQYAGRDLVRLFHQFTDHHICQRHLRRGELPHLWRWQPLFLLERIMGRYLVLKAFKPLSSALPTTLAA